jgi:ActR/RegA family two-component response regulator/DNA-binding HxlR family transcriptional regulator
VRVFRPDGRPSAVRILVVDDDEVFREELSTFLADDGHEPVSAPSVRKALEALEQENLDVVFTDLKMPRQSGMELVKEIHRRWPQVFVIVVTGFATIQTAVEAMKEGAFDYIAKPFRTNEVHRVLALVTAERKFSDARLPARDPHVIARELARRYKTTILLAAPDRPTKTDGVEYLAFDGRSPSDLPHAFEEFLRSHPKGGLVIAEADRMLEDHRLEDIVEILSGLRRRLEGNGPFAVSFRPDRVARVQAEAIRAAVTAPAVQGALEALSSPIRRRVLYRLADGPASFSDTMRAAELDDSPKLSFHLHRLLDEGLIVRDGELYDLTPKGKDAVAVLREMEDMTAATGAGAFVYQSPAPDARISDSSHGVNRGSHRGQILGPRSDT